MAEEPTSLDSLIRVVFCCPGPRPLGTLSQSIQTLGPSALQRNAGTCTYCLFSARQGQYKPEHWSHTVWVSIPATRASVFLPSWNLSVLICRMGIIIGPISQGPYENLMNYHHRKCLALSLAHSKCSIKRSFLMQDRLHALTVP